MTKTRGQFHAGQSQCVPGDAGKGERRTIFDPEVDVYLMQDVAHTRRGRVGEQDEAQIGGCLVKVQLVVGGAVADEGVVVAAELADHVAQGKDGAEDELGVVGGGGRLGRHRSLPGRRGGEPGLGIDAFGW